MDPESGVREPRIRRRDRVRQINSRRAEERRGLTSGRDSKKDKTLSALRGEKLLVSGIVIACLFIVLVIVWYTRIAKDNGRT